MVSTELNKLQISTDDIVISGDDNNIGVARLTDVLSQEEIAEIKVGT